MMMNDHVSQSSLPRCNLIKQYLYVISLAIPVWLFTPALEAQTISLNSIQVDRIISRFLQVENTHLHIENTTVWAFSGRIDSLTLDVMILDSTHFRLFLQAQNMEIMGYETKLYTVNHGQRQIIIEPLNPHDLVQRFLGPLFSDVVVDSQTVLTDGHKLNFSFSDPYSEWTAATVWLSKDWLVQQMVLTDVESNRVQVKMSYLNLLDGFYADDILENSYEYRIADLTQSTSPETGENQ